MENALYFKRHGMFDLLQKASNLSQEYNLGVAAYFSMISIKIILKKNYMLNCGVPPALPTPPPALLFSCFALLVLALPMLAYAAHAYI